MSSAKENILNVYFKLQYISPVMKTRFGFKVIKCTYVAILLALPTPHAFMVIGLDTAPISFD
jgi:hypothetical protein